MALKFETEFWDILMTLSFNIMLQEVFHVDLKNIENAVTHLFLVIFGNN